MTRRERIEKRLERRREWADGARAKAASAHRAAYRAVDGIPPGQPILVGHHSERGHRRALERADQAMRRGIERGEMAARHSSKAANLERALERTVFSDDGDALEKLEERIAEREAERDRIKRYNATARKAAKKGEPHGDLSILSEEQREDLATLLRVCPYQVRPGGAFPAYKLSNLSGRIKADRDRMAQIKRQAERQAEAEEAGGVVVKRYGESAQVTFAEKPERSVINALKAAGFFWNGGSWHGRAEDLPEEVA
jgi:hypothetical protein